MKIFINYQLTNAFRVAQSRDKISAIKHMIHGGMEPIKATRFVEAMSQDLADTWQFEKYYLPDEWDRFISDTATPSNEMVILWAYEYFKKWRKLAWLCKKYAIK